MALEVVSPTLGQGGTGGVVAEWYFIDGATVRTGDAIFRYESDFVAVEVEADDEGTLARRAIEGQPAAAGKVIAFILRDGEEAPLLPEPEDDPDSDRDVAYLALAADDGSPEAGAGRDHEHEAHAGPQPLPLLRRGRAPGESVPPAAPNGAWSGIFGDSQTFGDEVWEAAQERRVAALQEFAPEGAEEVAVAADQPQVSLASAWVDESPIESLLYDNAEPDAGSSEDEAEPPPPIPFPGVGAYEARQAEDATMGVRTSPVLSMKTPIRLTEARKVRDQLTREWRGAVAVPGDDDIMLRALARAAMENPRLAVAGDAAGVISLGEDGERLAVLRGAARGGLRQQVAALHNARSAHDDSPCAFTLVSLAPFDVQEGTPALPEGHSFALATGATQQIRQGDEVIPALMTLATLAYDPQLLPMVEAARLLARFRELMEAPYALLAE